MQNVSTHRCTFSPEDFAGTGKCTLVAAIAACVIGNPAASASNGGSYSRGARNKLSSDNIANSAIASGLSSTGWASIRNLFIGDLPHFLIIRQFSFHNAREKSIKGIYFYITISYI